MKRLYPVFVDLTGRKVLVVGGGKVTQRKVLALLDCQGRVVVVSPRLTEKLSQLHDRGIIAEKKAADQRIEKDFEKLHMKKLTRISTSVNTIGNLGQAPIFHWDCP